MSYDLLIQPKAGERWTAAAVTQALSSSRRLRPLAPGSWELRLEGADAASVDLDEHPDLGPVVERVSRKWREKSRSRLP